MTQRRLTFALVAVVIALSACSGHKAPPGLKHAQAACVHWAKLNAGIKDVGQRQAESARFRSEATAAADANAKYVQLKEASEAWLLVQSGPLGITDVSSLQQAINAARSACAAVPTK
jgi:hypothetical protein